MKKFLSLFPLSLVVFPFEDLNLHVFESRYKQLVNECLETNTNFGIPSYINQKLERFGTEVTITHLEKKYEDGRMDIRTKGVSIFKIISFLNPVEGKLYAGGDVEPQVHDLPRPLDPTIAYQIQIKIEELYEILHMPIPFEFNKPFLSFEIAHKIGLSIEQEYELLCMRSEAERQAYILAHLQKAIPIVSEMERTKEKIGMNGHFKNLGPINF